MATGKTVDAVWVDVLPSLVSFGPALRAGLAATSKDAAAMGALGGDAYGKAFGDSAATAVEKASAKVSAAQKKLADAEGAVAVKRAQLNDLTNSGTASTAKLTAAQEALEKAERNVELQTARNTLAQDNYTKAQDNLTAAQARVAAAQQKLDTLTASGTASTKALAAAQKELAAAQSQVEVATSKVASTELGVQRTAKALADAQGAAVVAQQKLNDVRSAGTASTSQVAAAEEALAKAQRDVTVQSEAVAAAQAQQQRAMEAQTAAEAAAERGAVTFKDAMAGLREEGGLLTSGFGLMNKAMTAAFGIGIVAMPIDKLIKSTGDYQAALTRLVTTAGESTSNIKAVGQGMLDMAGQVGISAGDLAQGMYVVESSMPPTISGAKRAADALTILKAAAQGARQENANLPDVVNAVTTALHDYNKPASDAANITSQMITAVSHGKTTFGDLTAALHSVTPLAANLKVPFADIIGSLAAMTASGESADQATQNMASALRHLAAPTQPMIQELAQLGITARQFSTDLSTKGLAGTVQEVAKAITDHMGPSGQVVLDTMNKSKLAAESLNTMLGAMPASLQTISQKLLDGTMGYKDYRKAVQALGGSQTAMGQQFLSLVKTQDGYSNALKAGNSSIQNFNQALQKSMGTADGANVALQLMGVHTDAVNAIISDVARSSADASGNIKGWGEVQSNFNQQMAEATHQLGAMWIELGQHLLPALTAAAGYLNRDVLPGIKNFAGAVSDAWHNTAQWVQAHKTLVQTIGVGIGTIAGVAGSFLAIKKAMDLGSAGVDLLRVGWGKMLGAISGNPFAITVTALAGLAAAFDFAYQHSKFLQQGWHDVVVGFENGKASVGDSGVAAALETVGAAASHVWQALQQVGQVIRTDAISAFGGLKTAAKDLWDMISGIVPAFEGFYKSVGQYLVTGFHDLVNIAPTLLDALKNIGDTAGGVLLTGLKDVGVIIGGLVVAGGKLVQWSLDLATGLQNLATAVTSHAQGPLKILADTFDALTRVLAAVPSQITLVAAAIAGLKLTGLWDSLVLKGMYAVDTLKGVFSALALSAKTAAVMVGDAMAEVKTAFTVGAFESEIQGAGKVEQALSGMASVGGAAVKGMGSVISGVGKTAFSDMKTAAKGLLDFFGGSWGVGIIGVTAGIWAITAAISAHDQQVKQDTQTMTGWYKSIANFSQDAQGAQTAYADIMDKQKQLADAQANLNKLTADQNGIMQQAGRGASGYSAAINAAKGKVADLSKEFKDSYNALSPLEQKQVDLYTAIQNYGAISPQAASAAQKLNDQQQKLAKLANDAQYAIEGENGQVRQSMDLQLQSVDATLGAQQATLDAKSAIEQYTSTLKDSNATDTDKAIAQNSMAEAISQAVQQTEQATLKNEQSVNPQKRSADAVAAARDVFNQLTQTLGGVPPQLQALADKLNGPTDSALANTQGALADTQGSLNTTQTKLEDLGGQFQHLANNDVAQVAIPGLQNLQKEMNGPTVSALTNGQSAAGDLGQAFVNTNGKVTTVFIPGLMQMQGNLNGPTVQALLNTLANTNNTSDAIGYLTTAVKNMPPGTTIDIGADTTAATNSIDTLITSYGKVTYTGTSIIVNGRVIANATGNILTSGSSQPMSASLAQVVQPGTVRVIGDNPVSDEAFIPIDNSTRSHAILGETAGRMGYNLVPVAAFSAGGIVTQPPLASPIGWPAWQAPNLTFPIQWQSGFLDSIAQDMTKMQQAAAAFTGSVGGGAMQWRGLVDQVLGMLNVPQSADMGVLNIIQHESGGNPNAINLWDSNAAAGHPSQGLMQTIPGTFYAYAGPFASRGITDPEANIYAGVNYALHRYGVGMLMAGGNKSASGGYLGYDTGGQLQPGWTTLFNGTGTREVVLNPPQIDNLNKLLSAPVDHFYSNSVEHHRSEHTTQQAPLVGNIDISMAQSDPNEAINMLMHRLQVAQRGGVFATNPAYSG